jgi:hypothetical protein
MRIALPTLRRLHRLNALAPFVSFAILLATGIALKRHVTDPAVLAARNDEVVREFASIPYRLGPWIGSDVALPAGATEILHASAVVSRRFDELGTGRRAILGLVHCGDIRDMLGHYPPNCYPSSGYLECEQGHEPVELRVLGAVQPAMLYRFRRVDRAGGQREVTIVGAFILPEAGFTTDLSAVRSLAGNRANSEQGIGQLQVVLDGLVPKRDAIALAEDLVGRVPTRVFERLAATAGIERVRGADGEVGEVGEAGEARLESQDANHGATARGSRGNP